MIDREVDVLVIGGGPAGLSSGIAFASHGLKTMICEQRRLPTDKACGEGVMPVGLTRLRQLGVVKHLQPGTFHPFIGVRYISPAGFFAEGVFREGPGWGIPRLALSTALKERAQELPALDLVEGVKVRPIGREVGRVIAAVGKEQVAARLLVGADGLNSQVRQWAGLQGSSGSLERWGARLHYPISPWSDFVEVYWKDGIEAYVTPCGDHLVGVAFLWDRRRFGGIRGGLALIPSLLQAFPELRVRLRGSTACDAPLAIGPMQRGACAPVADGVALVGDAAGYLDAITGEGISLALAQAVALEKTIVPLLKDRGRTLNARDLAGYAQAHREIVRPYYWMTRLVLWLSQRPRLAESAIRSLGAMPGLFQFLLSANMGSIQMIRKESS